MRGYRAPRLRVTLDDRPPEPCGFVIVAKLANYGGLFAVTPDARPDSGRLDACLFRDASFGGLVRIVWPAWRGRLADRSDCLVVGAHRIRIEAVDASPVSVQLDGDAWGATPVDLSVEARVVPMLVP